VTVKEYMWNLMDHDPSCSELTSSDFKLIGPLKKNMAGKIFATGADVKRVFSYWLFNARI
jgi:hypothetical protein